MRQKNSMVNKQSNRQFDHATCSGNIYENDLQYFNERRKKSFNSHDHTSFTSKKKENTCWDIYIYIYIYISKVYSVVHNCLVTTVDNF